MNRLTRLLRPKSVAVVGGGSWCQNVIEELDKMAFEGPIWPVHPSRTQVRDRPACTSVDQLPAAPDACFVGVNKHATIDVVKNLAQLDAGGAICFASGFKEAAEEDPDGSDLHRRLLNAAGDMPIIGPNCYGFINALDRAPLWPDQHGASHVTKGVALITQSSNIAINLTMQQRGLPIAYVITAGNQAQTDLAELALAVLDDPRVTALGLHIEGIGDVRRFEAMAARARELGKSIVALKIGASEHARQATISHTASLAGSDAGGRALLRRLGIAQVGSLPALLETLKLLHVAGPLKSNRLASASCSGGEASLIADMAEGRALNFPALTLAQKSGLRDALGARVKLANPLDYHTYVWGDIEATTQCFTALLSADLGVGCAILDLPIQPGADITLWRQVIDCAATSQSEAGVPMAIVSTLPETLPKSVCEEAINKGLVPLCGLDEALDAIEAAAWLGQTSRNTDPVLLGQDLRPNETTSEADAKALLSSFGLDVPAFERRIASDLGELRLSYPVVLKAEGLAHKSDHGGVVLNLEDAHAVQSAAERLPGPQFLIEEMITDAVAELLIGVTVDPAHGFVLTLGAGGTLTELWQDTVSLLLPVTHTEIKDALAELRIWPLLNGYRGRPAADIEAITATILAIQDCVTAQSARLVELEVNPLLCLTNRAVAADALITYGDPDV